MALGLLYPVPSVGLSVGREDLGVGLTGHHITRPHREIMQRSHGLNGPLDSFSRPDESPGEYDGPSTRLGHDTRVGMAAPWAMVVTLEGSTSKPSHSRARAASVMTTTRSARAATSFSTDR